MQTAQLGASNGMLDLQLTELTRSIRELQLKATNAEVLQHKLET